MCVVSFIGSHYQDKWSPYFPYPVQRTFPNQQSIPLDPLGPARVIPPPSPSKLDFDNLKNEVEEMKELLRKAKIYDEQNNEPNCEIESKMIFLREIADMVGVDLDDVLKKKDEGKKEG